MEMIPDMDVTRAKHGNDDDYFDQLAAEVPLKTNEEIKKFNGVFGFRYIADGSGMLVNFGLAVGTGATPDGRRMYDAC